MPEDIEFGKLGVVMVEVGPLPSLDIVGEGAEDDLFYGKDERLKYAQGDVGTSGGHVTVLFGIHPYGGWKSDTKAILSSWEPDDIEIESVDHFPSSVEGQDYSVIVGKVKKTPNLVNARERVELLPFSDRFADNYTPRVTIAYIKGTADLEKWKSKLNQVYAGKTFKPEGITIK